MGWSISARACALGFEAGDHLPGVHAQLDDLQRHAAANRLLLLGHEDDAEAPFADLLQQLVGADDASRAFGERVNHGHCDFRGRGLQEIADVRLDAQEPFDPLANFFVAGAGFVEIGRLFPEGRLLEGRQVNLVDARHAVIRFVGSPGGQPKSVATFDARLPLSPRRFLSFFETLPWRKRGILGRKPSTDLRLSERF